jgi:SAM-dependent methyltransferase
MAESYHPPRSSPAAPRAAYGSGAEHYDDRTRTFARYRRRAVELLPLARGDVVLDVGCGTGLCFGPLLDRVGPSGAVVGVDSSSEMLEVATAKVAERGWGNVRLVHAEVERAELPAVDHALFCAVHDVLQSPAALDHVLAHVREGGGVAATGGKWAPAWAVPVNAGVMALHAPFVDSFDGFDRPWALLADRVAGLQVSELALGAGYAAWGRPLPQAGKAGAGRGAAPRMTP